MGLWDRQIEDLHALGVRFSDLELRTLEEPPEGMLVLHLHPLWDPRAVDGQIAFMKDENGQDIWKPEILKVLNPNDTNTHGWGDAKRTTRLWEVMETNYGSVSARYPSYFGIVTESSSHFDDNVEWMRRDEQHPYPFWTCLPLGWEMEIQAAERLIAASERSLNASLYSELTFICEIEQRSEWCITADEEWLLVNDPEWLKGHYNRVEFDKENDMRTEAWAEYVDPEDMQEILVAAYQALLDAGVIHDPRLTPEEERKIPLKPYRFPPIEDFLDNGDFVAQQMWRSIRSRTEFMHYRMASLFGVEEKHTMQHMEGILG